MINLNTQKLIWEQQIRNECTKYQIFIGDSNMPKYKINLLIIKTWKYHILWKL